jgi:hypothetical protein
MVTQAPVGVHRDFVQSVIGGGERRQRAQARHRRSPRLQGLLPFVKAVRGVLKNAMDGSSRVS